MGRFMINYWPSFLLSLVLLTGIVVSLRRFDFVIVEEMRAMISIMFGFATSCFLLSFIWLIQRKSRTDLDLDGDVPSMHPRGRIDSDGDSHDESHNRISIISSDILDIPPAYEEALVNSKPMNNWYKSQGIKHSLSCPCSSKSKWPHVTPVEGCNCVSSASKQRCPLGHNKTLDTPQKLSTLLATNNYYTHYGSIEQTSLSRPTSSDSFGSTSRKISYVQLDVEQLMLLSSSPPKYHELTFGQHDKGHNQDLTINIT